MKARLSYVLAVAAMLAIVGQSFAGPVTIEQVGGAPAGNTTNDIKINAPAGILIGSMQILLQLNSGQIFEHPFQNASPNPPNSAFFPLQPDLPYDSFLAVGEAANTAPLVLGPSLGLGGPAPPAAVFNATTYDASYGPPLGQDNTGRQGYYAARLTLSNNANGMFRFKVDFSDDTSAGSGFGNFGELPVVNGVVVPEPATITLLGLAAFGVVGLVRRRK